MDNIKKFEDFLDRMQRLLDEAKKQGHIIVRVEDLENAFPELAESEDKMIRKWLIGQLKQGLATAPKYVNHNNAEKAISWLEKQGEQKLEMKSAEESLGIDSETYNKIVDECVYGEQKPTEEYNITGIHSKHAEGKLGEMIKRKLEIEKQGEQKTPWLKELKEKLDSMSKEELQQLWDKYKQPFELTNEDLEDVEQKPAWSEEDDEMLDSIIEEVRYMGDFPDYPTKEENELYDECLAKVEWLKSLKERYTWKPSDEHYELEEFAKIVRGNLTGISEAVQELFKVLLNLQ